ncbi:MAG: hypothetical protein AAF447_15375 [Myxococcota bacterium]
MRTLVFRAAWLVATLTVACDDPAPEPLAPEQPPAADAPGAQAATPAEAPREEAEAEAPETRMVRVVRFPEGEDVRLSTFASGPIRRIPIPEDGWGEPGSYATVRPGDDPALAERINAYIRQQATQGDPEYPGKCRIAFAHPRLLSVRCEVMEIYERGGADLTTVTSLVKVTEDGFEALRLEDAFSPTASLDAKARRACARTLRREGRAPAEAERGCRGQATRARALTRRGVRFWVPDYDERGHLQDSLPVLVPFAELDGGVLADHPLGKALAELPGTRVEEVLLPPGLVAPGEVEEGTAFGKEAIAQVAIGEYLALPAAARAELVLAGGDAGYRLARPASSEAPAAVALGEGRAASWTHALVPRVVRTRVETSFRVRPGEMRTLILPPGTLVGVGLGRVHGRESAMGERGTWALTAAAPGVFGYTAGALLEAHEGCEPPTEAFLSAVPGSQRERAEASLVRASLELRRGGRGVPVFAYGAALLRESRRREGRSRVEIFERSGECALGRRLARHDLDGNLYAIRFAKTRPHGGKTLLLLGSYRRMRIHWELFELGGDEPLWSTAHSRGAGVEVRAEVREGEDYFPVVVEDDGEPTVRLAWGEDGVEVL